MPTVPMDRVFGQEGVLRKRFWWTMKDKIPVHQPFPTLQGPSLCSFTQAVDKFPHKRSPWRELWLVREQCEGETLSIVGMVAWWHGAGYQGGLQGRSGVYPPCLGPTSNPILDYQPFMPAYRSKVSLSFPWNSGHERCGKSQEYPWCPMVRE